MDILTKWMITSSGRSWWQTRYLNGRVLSEWQTTTGGKPGTSRWEEIPKHNMVALRLLCPDGMAGELEGCKSFFQLKVGFCDVGIGGGKSGRSCAAHIIGRIDNDNGDCSCYAWDYRQKKLLHFKDNVLDMKFENIGRLNLLVQGVA